MMKIAVKVMKLKHFKGELPTYGTEHASGFDLVAQLPYKLTMSPGERALITNAGEPFLYLESLLPRGRQARPRTHEANEP